MLLLVSFITSCVFTFMIIVTEKLHFKYTADKLAGIQKYHQKHVPRIGGLSIFAALVLSMVIFLPQEIHDTYVFGLMISAFLVFLLGFFEDLVGEIPSLLRLLVVTGCSLFAIFYTNVLLIVSYSDILLLDQLLKFYPIVGIVLSLFCVVGLTNAFNIIDGYNGLSSTTAVCSLITLFYFSYIVGLPDVGYFILCFIGAILGFIVFNYPWGKIFLGDGGAYVIGFLIAVISIYVVHTDSRIISPYAVLLVNIYPIVEIGFSIFRRKILTKTESMKPDNRHLHHLVYHRCIAHKYKNRNPLVVVIMLFYIIPQNIVAMYCYDSTKACLLAIAIYIVYYVVSYFSILRFRALYHLKFISK